MNALEQVQRDWQESKESWHDRVRLLTFLLQQGPPPIIKSRMAGNRTLRIWCAVGRLQVCFGLSARPFVFDRGAVLRMRYLYNAHEKREDSGTRRLGVVMHRK